MKYVLALTILLLVPACSSGGHNDQVTPVPAPEGTAELAATVVNVFHDGHLFLLVLYYNGKSGGSILHSPACPYDRSGTP